MVNNPRFVEAIQAKIGTAVDTEDMEKQIAVLQGRLKQAFGTKSRLERQMDTLDINDAHYDRKILDLQRRYDEQYDTIEEIEVQIGELQSQIRSIQQEKISGDNIYRLLLAFDEVYHSATEAEQKEFMKAFIERIEMFPEKRKDGSWIKKHLLVFEKKDKAMYFVGEYRLTEMHQNVQPDENGMLRRVFVFHLTQVSDYFEW